MHHICLGTHEGVDGELSEREKVGEVHGCMREAKHNCMSKRLRHAES
jgi:hypothetical protein